MTNSRIDGETVDILVTAPLPVVGAETTKGLTFHRLWEVADAGIYLDQLGKRIRAVAAAGKLRIDGPFLDRLPHVELVANFGVGYDRVDVDAARERGVVVTNTPDVLTEEVADLTLGLLIAAIRAIPQADAFLRRGEWARKAFPLSASLRGRTVGILGLGRIGKAVARRLEASAVTVAYHGRSRQPDVPYRYYPSLIEMAHAVDTLVIVAPGTAETNALVDAEVLAALGPNGVLVNVARGSIIDERALIQALKTGALLAAGLDVFADEPDVPPELIACENAVLLPHVGSGSHHTRDAMGRLVLDNIISWFDGRGPLTPVPETPVRTR